MSAADVEDVEKGFLFASGEKEFHYYTSLYQNFRARAMQRRRAFAVETIPDLSLRILVDDRRKFTSSTLRYMPLAATTAVVSVSS